MSNYKGIYEIPEATQYLYITAPDKYTNYSTVRRWIRKDLFAPEARRIPIKELVINFEELVSLRMIVALRLAGFSLRQVREAHQWLIEKTGYRNPFALRDLWISDTEIFVELQGLLSITKKGQFSFEFLKGWLRKLRRPDCSTIDSNLDLSFESINGKEVASKWTPHPCVVLNPLIQFGSPCIEDTRIPTRSAWAMFIGGDSPKSIAKSYSLPPFKVESALEWEKKIAGATS